VNLPTTIKIELTPQELDQVCIAVGLRPWNEVNPLLMKIIHQANNQPQESKIDPLPTLPTN